MWAGPIKGGITQSLISKFLECPYRFYLYAILGLKEYEPPEPNLVYGDTGHVGLEHIIRKPHRIVDFTKEDWEHVEHEMRTHMKRFYPTAPKTYVDSLLHMLPLYNDEYKENDTFETELPFRITHTTVNGNKVVFRGKKDGENADGTKLIEHKFKGYVEAQQIRYETPIDLQVNVYAYASNCTEMIYDNIKIPDTLKYKPPKRQAEKPLAYIHSLYHTRDWGDFPITRKKHMWLFQEHVPIDREENKKYIEFTVDPICDRICAWYKHVTDPNFDLENPKCYNEIFYQTPIRHFDPSRTQSYKCSYHGYLTGQIDREDLVSVDDYYPEIHEEENDQEKTKTGIPGYAQDTPGTGLSKIPPERGEAGV